MAGLVFDSGVCVVRHKKSGQPTGSVIDRYRYPPQDCDIDEGDVLKLRDGRTFGSVVGVDRVTRHLDVRKGPAVAAEHPSSAFVHDQVSPGAPAAALLRLGEAVASGGCAAAAPGGGGRDLLPMSGADLADVDRGSSGVGIGSRGAAHHPERRHVAAHSRPARVRQDVHRRADDLRAAFGTGKRVGVTATSHKVIRNLLETVRDEAAKKGQRIRLGHKVRDDDDETDAGIEAVPRQCRCGRRGDRDRRRARRHRLALGAREVRGRGRRPVRRRSRPDVARQHAGRLPGRAQPGAARRSAAARATAEGQPSGRRRRVGARPRAGWAPDDAGGSRAVPADHLAPRTGDLRISRPRCSTKASSSRCPASSASGWSGAGRFDGAGLCVVDVAHDGCRNASDEEVEAVAAHRRRPARARRHGGSTRRGRRADWAQRTSSSSRRTTRRSPLLAGLPGRARRSTASGRSTSSRGRRRRS